MLSFQKDLMVSVIFYCAKLHWFPVGNLKAEVALFDEVLF